MRQPNWEKIGDRAMREVGKDRESSERERKEKWWHDFLAKMEEFRLGSERRTEWKEGHKFEAVVFTLLKESGVFGPESNIHFAAICDDLHRLTPKEVGGDDLVIHWEDKGDNTDSLLTIDTTFSRQKLFLKLSNLFPIDHNFNHTLGVPPRERGRRTGAIPTICGVDKNVAEEILKEFYNLKIAGKSTKNSKLFSALLLEILLQQKKQIEESSPFTQANRQEEYQKILAKLEALVAIKEKEIEGDSEARHQFKVVRIGMIAGVLTSPRSSLASA